jgi:hypothetical protein
MKNVSIVSALGFFALTVVACGGAETDPQGPVGGEDGPVTAAQDAGSTVTPPKKSCDVDISNLSSCTAGKKKLAGLCAKDPNVVKQFKDSFYPCEGSGLCLPENLARSTFYLQLKVCKSIAGAPGRCFSGIAKDVDTLTDFEASTLELATENQCGANELCLPCEDKGKPTGVCDAPLVCPNK